MNLDPGVSDEEYERRLREKGEFGVPWWTIQEAYMNMSARGPGVIKRDAPPKEEKGKGKEREEDDGTSLTF